MPEVAEAGTQTKQQTAARTISLSKAANVAQPWWVAQVRAVRMQLQVQSTPDLVVAAVDLMAETSTMREGLEVLELLLFATRFPP